MSGAVVIPKWVWDIKENTLGSAMVSTLCPPPGICHTSHLVTLPDRAMQRPSLRPGHSCNLSLPREWPWLVPRERAAVRRAEPAGARRR